MEALPNEITAEVLQYVGVEARLVCRRFDDIYCDILRRKPIMLFLCDDDTYLIDWFIESRLEIEAVTRTEKSEHLIQNGAHAAQRIPRIILYDYGMGSMNGFIRRINPINWKVHVIRRKNFTTCGNFIKRNMPILDAKFGVKWNRNEICISDGSCHQTKYSWYNMPLFVDRIIMTYQYCIKFIFWIKNGDLCVQKYTLSNKDMLLLD